jgi:hypothetical protein
MCNVLLLPGVNPTAVKYIYHISYHIISYHIIYQYIGFHYKEYQSARSAKVTYCGRLMFLVVMTHYECEEGKREREREQ